MSKIVQLVGHLFDVAKDFIGADRELTVDQSNRRLILHDGVTPGGKVFLPFDQLIARFQAQSNELDGLLSFSIQDRGILCRLGPASYTIRQIEGTLGEIAVTNSSGLQGNPTFGLPATITKAITFSGAVTFSAGIAGNITGNVIGNVTGDVTGNLTGNASGNHTGNFAGNVDVRGKTFQIDDNKIAISKVIGLTQALTNVLLPAGSIIAWGGPVANIPVGWAICDGSVGTPDLRNKFILGASPVVAANYYVPGQTGGVVTHNHAIAVDAAAGHTHAVAVDGHVLTIPEMPEHGHHAFSNASTQYNTLQSNPNRPAARETTGSSSGASYTMGADASTPATLGLTEAIGGGQAHGHGATSSASGGHTHDASSSQATNMPPFYAFCYIIRI